MSTRTALRLLALLTLVLVAPAQADARSYSRQPLWGMSVATTPGVPSAAPSAEALSGSLSQATGLTPSQVTAVGVCPPAAPGMARCAAQALVLRSNHRRVHPHIPARSSVDLVIPRGVRRTAASPASGAPASAAPQADTPAWLQQAYDLAYLSQTKGAGDTVAIVDAHDDPGAAADLAVFRNQYGLPACTTANGCFRKVNQNGQASPLPARDLGWEGEESLDLDAVSALCSNCHILLVEANSSLLTDMDASVMTAAAMGANQISNSWAAGLSSPLSGTYTFPGVSVIAASGDGGYIGGGLAAYPAALPGVIAAGGTSLAAATGAQSPRGFSESAWSLNSNGWGGGSGCNTQVPKPVYQLDTGCTGRSYADLSADADPNTGLGIYDSGNGGWMLYGGTSLATPLIAAYEAVTGVGGLGTSSWAYGADSALLNDPTTGSTGSCPSNMLYICTAGVGYDGPTGVGSISGSVAQGAPGIGGPSVGSGYNNTYTVSVNSITAVLAGGVYPNGLDTTYWWQYGTSSAYGQQTQAADIGSGQTPAAAPGTLPSLAPSTTYHYRLVAQNSDGTAYGYDYTLTTLTGGSSPPVSTTQPSIAGTVKQGQTLSVSTGSWSPGATSYAYQWQRSGDQGSSWTNISGATGSSYLLAGPDVNDEIQVNVTATNTYGSATATATGVGPVVSSAPFNTAAPVISGDPHQGEVLTVSSSWNPPGSSYAYQWQRSTNGSTWAAISGATGSSYTLVPADERATIEVVVTAINVYGQVSATSAAVGPVHSNPPVNTAARALTGTTQRTYTLTATQGSWSGPGNSYYYQWQRSPDGAAWTNIAGATASTYALAVADEGDDVQVTVTASNLDGVASQASNATTQIIAPFPPANVTPPAISGTAQRSSVLSATLGAWTGPGNVYSYQWQRDSGEGYVAISGATSSADTLGVVDEGSTVRVLVTAANPDATIVEASQPTTTSVRSAIPVNNIAPTVTGTVARSFTLSASQGSWGGVGNTYTYQWQDSLDGNTWTNIPTATAATYTLGVGDESTQLQVVVTASNTDGPVSATSTPTVMVPKSPPLKTTAPTISGTAQRTVTLTSTQGSWSGIGNSYAYQWQRSTDGGATWTSIGGATGSTYTLAFADEGATVNLLVTATNPDGNFSAASAASATVQQALPVNLTVPTISGAAQRTATLTSTPGSWGGLGNSYAYQWQRSTDGTNWTDITSATGSTYTLAVADEHATVHLLVIATNADASSNAASAPTATVLAAPPVNTAAPTIAGIAARASTLSATNGAWSGIGNQYVTQWQRSPDGAAWMNISGATGPSYTLGVLDEGTQIRMLVTATNPDTSASGVTAHSPASATVPGSPPVNTAPPTLSGTPQRSATLTGAPGTWDGIGNTYTYQWQKDAGFGFANITGATSSIYTLAVADEGTRVRLLISAINADGTASAPSTATAPVLSAPPVNTGVPTIAGTPQRTMQLTSTQGDWSGLGNAYAYQWQRSPDQGTTWTNINGATGTTYTLGLADVGAAVRLNVTATNPDTTASAASAPTATVLAAPPVNVGLPSLSGLVQRSSLMTATLGSWSGLGNAYTYQWQRSTDGSHWTSITGATASTYTLGVVDEGTAIRVQITATNADAAVSAASAPTTAVPAEPPVNTAAPTIAGTPQRSTTLTSTQGSWSGVGNAYAEQWQRSGDGGSTWTNIAGATGSSYTLGTADNGDQVRLQVTAANPDATASAASAPTATVLPNPPVNNTAPTIAGTPQRTIQLISTQGSWSGAGNAYANQWQRSTDQGHTWANIGGATSATYTLAVADEAANVRLLVTATNPDGPVSAASAPSAAVQVAPPANSSVPTITGAARIGATDTASVGNWNPAAASFSYDWQRGNAGSGYRDIQGATSASYTLQPADVGLSLQVIVTATNVDGHGTANSAATMTIAAPPQNMTAPAAPTGTLLETDTLTAAVGTWDTPSATFAYAWLRCPADATSVTAGCAQVGSGPSYTLVDADVGSPIGVTVTASSAGGQTSVDSALTAAISGLPLTNTTPPSIGGNPQVPQTLTANPGQWSVAVSSVSYTWERCDADGVSNCGAVSSSPQYTLTAADAAHTIVLIATAVAPGRAATAQSPPLTIATPSPPQSAIAPTVTGTAARGRSLSASSGTWTNSPTQFAYQWERCDSSGKNCQIVPGATVTAYVPTKADEGSTLTVQVTVTNGLGSGSATATPTAPVTAVPPVNTKLPVIQAASLPIQQGVSLDVAGFLWQTTPDTTYGIAWERCDSTGANCQAIAGATNIDYTLGVADVAHTLVAVSTATNADGVVSARSIHTQVTLPAAPRWKALPILSADPGDIGDSLSITNGVWSGPVISTDTTQMMRCTNICATSGPANVGSYTIIGADLGAVLRVRETASNAGGDTVVWSALYVGPVISAQAGSAVLSNRQTALRNSHGVTLALAQMSSLTITQDVKGLQTKRAPARTRTVKLRRAGKVTGTLIAWACPVALARDGRPAACTGKVTLRNSTTLRLPALATGRVRVVVIRRGH